MKRESVLNSSDEKTRTMALPVGKSCWNCRVFPTCHSLIGIKGDNEVCDFYPNRFITIRIESLATTKKEG